MSLPTISPAEAKRLMDQGATLVAGSLILLGVGLGQFIAPVFYGLAALVGAGLTFAGVSGWCGMAKLLALMPWNRSASAPRGRRDEFSAPHLVVPA
ncbi:MAG: DUF2892 domain-containing protein [Hyphomicrobiaceae bacterium]